MRPGAGPNFGNLGYLKMQYLSMPITPSQYIICKRAGHCREAQVSYALEHGVRGWTQSYDIWGTLKKKLCDFYGFSWAITPRQ